ncbi:MAG TPA: sucrose-6-phosphate hydrolase [Lachnospiraceae bacterium]|nr:sucrose-6-phosphate hydrolase [Lachnospiraceae bacterium]
MISKKLQQARDYEREHMGSISPQDRPVFHITPGIGWLNDPNGFSYYNGEYHVFYQYHPYSTEWGPMHWGHVAGKDLLTWDRYPVVMAPDEEYDNFGCFSGSALGLEDGRQLLLYTGVHTLGGFENPREMEQTQCVAIGDGINYEKCDANPLIRISDVPGGGQKSDFRDPKIWRDPEDGKYYCVAASMDHDGNGRILEFESGDLLHWQYRGEIAASRGNLGKMWECPDFFSLNGKQVVLVSLMAVQPDGVFHTGHNTACMIGDYDKENCVFERETLNLLDCGIDFYAPQTMCAPDGRRIMIGWMQSPTNAKFVPEHARFFGQMTVPRELEVKDGKLFQNPVREILKHRVRPVVCKNVEVEGRKELEGVSGRVVDMTVHISASGAESFAIQVACDDIHHTDILFEPERQMLRIDRSACGYLFDIVHTREFPIRCSEHGELTLRLLIDRMSVEVFVNDGEQAATATIFTPQAADAIRFECKGKARISVEKYDLDI